MEVDRKQILQSFLDNIYGISDKEFQRRIWIEGRGPECHDFDEACCDFFEEGDAIIENYKKFEIADRQCLILKQFRDEFTVFADENDWPPLFIDTPEWDHITKMAKEVLKEFHYKKVDSI